MTTTIREALAAAARRLAEAGVDQPRLDARLLLAHALDAPEERFYGREDDPLNVDASRRFEALTIRRADREPVSRIIGRRGFWDLELELAPATLDPRPDTETLVERALEAFPDRDAALRMLDLGTGTGCLLLAVLGAYPNARGIGTDLAGECVAVATRNAERAGLAGRAAFRQSDWTAEIEGIFDVIMCNPPYIPAGDIDGLEPEVARHDPRLALDGGPDGLDCYRRVLPEMAALLAQNGRIFLEIGADQRQGVEALARACPLDVVDTVADLGGRDRCVILTLPKPAP